MFNNKSNKTKFITGQPSYQILQPINPTITLAPLKPGRRKPLNLTSINNHVRRHQYPRLSQQHNFRIFPNDIRYSHLLKPWAADSVEVAFRSQSTKIDRDVQLVSRFNNSRDWHWIIKLTHSLLSQKIFSVAPGSGTVSLQTVVMKSRNSSLLRFLSCPMTSNNFRKVVCQGRYVTMTMAVWVSGSCRQNPKRHLLSISVSTNEYF